MFIAVTVVLAALLSGCHGENSITGVSMESRVLSGQVVPAGNLAGASPAGISVAAAGQIASTDSAGRFAFMGLSNNDVSLNFSRADGVNASAMVSASAASVIVQLEKTKATVTVTGQSKREIEGLITDISATSITVKDASTGGPVTAAITSATAIRKGNQTLTATDLKAGDRVHVKASVEAGGTLTAFEIMLQQSGDGSTGTGGTGGQTKELEGLITAVSDTSITVMNASTNSPVTAAITSSTVIRKGNTRLTAKDLKVGDRVHVKTSGSGDSLTATEIMRQNPGD